MGIICPSPVQIGLTDMQNIGGASGPPGPPGSGTTEYRVKEIGNDSEYISKYAF